MKRKTTKLTALVISLLMLIPLLPAVVFAADNPSDNVLNYDRYIAFAGDTGAYTGGDPINISNDVKPGDVRISQRVIADNHDGSFDVQLIVVSGYGVDFTLQPPVPGNNAGARIVMGAEVDLSSYILLSGGSNSSYNISSGTLTWYPDNNGIDTLVFRIRMKDSALGQGLIPVIQPWYIGWNSDISVIVAPAGLSWAWYIPDDMPKVRVTYCYLYGHGNDADSTYTNVITAATCVTTGEMEVYCLDCGELIRTEIIPALGHNYIGVVTAPTCTEGGYTTYTCSRCYAWYIGDYTNAHPCGNCDVCNPHTTITDVSCAKFISIVETAKNSRVWLLTFEVTVKYSNGTSAVKRYTIELKGNNANLDGKFVFDATHELAGHTLTYDIKGNGSNIKAFCIK